MVEVSPGQLERLLRAGAVAEGWEEAWRRGLLGLRRMPRLEAMWLMSDSVSVKV